MSRSERRMLRIGLVAAVFWGVGTNLLDQRWYVFRGISVGDLLFGVWMMIALARPVTGRILADAAYKIQGHILLVTLLVVWLLLSVSINVFRFGGQPSDMFAILRFLYFCAIMVFCVAFVRRSGPAILTMAFVTGVFLLAVGRFSNALTGGGPIVRGLPLLRDPNVIGNMLGIGVLFNSLLILQGWTKWPLALTTAFTALSVLTFSKGAWLMVLLGIAANVLALIIRHPFSARGLKLMTVNIAALFLVLGALAYYNSAQLLEIIAFKYVTTADDGSVGLRYRLALAGFYAMADHPLFGLGFRNYYVVEALYPQLSLIPSDNAHNAFAHMAAVGGVPAIGLLMLMFVYPFVQLWKVVRTRKRGLLGPTYVAVTACAFFLSGAVQLQLIAQPFFWVFTGIVRGWRCRELDQKAARRPDGPLQRERLPH